MPLDEAAGLAAGSGTHGVVRLAAEVPGDGEPVGYRFAGSWL